MSKIEDYALLGDCETAAASNSRPLIMWLRVSTAQLF